MTFFRKDAYERGVKRKTFDIVVILAVVFGLLSSYLFVRLITSSTTDTHVRDVLVEEIRNEDYLAREAASQISRLGSSNTWNLLGQVRQHVYAMQEMNALSGALLDSRHPLLPADALSDALVELGNCEARLLLGQAIDAPLSNLWQNLNTVALAVIDLG